MWLAANTSPARSVPPTGQRPLAAKLLTTWRMNFVGNDCSENIFHTKAFHVKCILHSGFYWAPTLCQLGQGTSLLSKRSQLWILVRGKGYDGRNTEAPQGQGNIANSEKRDLGGLPGRSKSKLRSIRGIRIATEGFKLCKSRGLSAHYCISRIQNSTWHQGGALWMLTEWMNEWMSGQIEEWLEHRCKRKHVEVRKHRMSEHQSSVQLEKRAQGEYREDGAMETRAQDEARKLFRLC